MSYPDPLVIPPHALPHKHTFIICHGRGSSGEKFGPALLDSPISLPETARLKTATPQTVLTLATAFPHARFVFPTAARTRATIYKRALTHQWFDNWKLDPPATEREELQAPGLRETATYLHDLWRREIDAVPGGAASVVVGGLSQGCAATLVALLLWEGEPFAAAVGMCGSTPGGGEGGYGEAEDKPGHGNDDLFDPFEGEEHGKGDEDAPTRAIRWLREELTDTASAYTPLQLGYESVPVFLGHGVQDDRVSIILGRDAAQCLRGFGLDVCFKEYEALAHWYSGDLLRDMVCFVQTKAHWNTDDFAHEA